MQEWSRRSILAGTAGFAVASSSRGQPARPGTLSHRFDRERFVDDVRRAAGGSDAQREIRELLSEAVADSGSVIAGLGEPDMPGIHTLYRAADLTILNVVWAPLMVLLPHNHNMWASIGICAGREDNILWRRSGQRLEAFGAAALSAGDVFALEADAIHSVVNPIGRLTAAIHIYGGDFFAPGRSEWDAGTLKERPWDLDAARLEFSKAADRFSAVP